MAASTLACMLKIPSPELQGLKGVYHTKCKNHLGQFYLYGANSQQKLSHDTGLDTQLMKEPKGAVTTNLSRACVSTSAVLDDLQKLMNSY